MKILRNIKTKNFPSKIISTHYELDTRSPMYVTYNVCMAEYFDHKSNKLENHMMNIAPSRSWWRVLTRSDVSRRILTHPDAFRRILTHLDMLWRTLKCCHLPTLRPTSFVQTLSCCLADESRDLSQTKKKITVVKDEQIHKMTIIFTQNGQKLSFWVNLLIFYNT